jgi:hypothetical protein
VRIPLTDELVREMEAHQLRSACGDCCFFVAGDRSCAHGWPNRDQRRWPPGAADPDDDRDGPAPGRAEAHFCKEFELR